MRPHTKRRRALLAAALVAASGGFIAHEQMASATLTDSLFEGNDANTAGAAILANGAGLFDWANLLSAPSGTRVIGPDATTGQCDNSFTQGSKEDETNVVVGQGSIPNSKADLGQFAVGSLVPTSGTRAGNTIMTLAWVRNNTSGTTNFDFEINQVAQPNMTFATCPAPDTAVQLQRRGDGIANNAIIDDILISYDVQGGAQNPTLSFRRWVQDSQNPALPGYLTGHWGDPTMITSANSEGALNRDVAITTAQNGPFTRVPGTTGTTAIPAAQFGEAAIDMTGLGIIPNRNTSTACVAFGSGYVKSRASSSFTSQMKDYIAPIGLGINTCATIIIDKMTDPAGDPQLFTFNPSASLGGGASFQLADATTPKTYDNLTPGGAYSVAEVVPTGWINDSATCSDGSPVTAISLQANETVTCTFHNTKLGRVIVDKVTAPDPDPTNSSFGFTGSVGNFSLTNAATPFSTGFTLVPGSYNVAETTVPAGWTPDGASCDDGSSVGNIQVGAGETVTCTFHNTGYGRIIVHKETFPDGSPASFDYAADYTAPFSLQDGGSNDTGTTIAPGTYHVTETVPQGWVLSDITCVDANGSTDKATGTATIVLDPGETVDCYYTNTQNAQIIVEKHVVGPNPDDQSFPFSASYSGTGFQLKDGESNPSGDLAPGNYAVAESLLANWKLVNQNTTDGFSGSVICSNQQDSLQIVLNPGETVVCSFINERQVGAIEIVKTAKNKAAGGSVGVAGVGLTIHDVANNVDIPVVTGADGRVCVNYFGFGDYTVKEDSAPAGYSIDPNTYNVTINSVSYCDDGYGTPHHVVNVVDQPLTNVSIVVDSQVDGATETVIDCGAAGSKTVSDGSLDISDLVPTAPAATLTCTITVDP